MDIRPIISHREGQCLSEAKKVPRLCKSAGIPKGIYECLHIPLGKDVSYLHQI